MASLILAKNLFKLMSPNTFKKASSNSEIIIGGTSKFLFEKNLIQCETMVYSICLGIVQQDILSSGVLIIGGVFGSHLLPAYRLFKSWENKEIKIINCEYRPK